MENTNNLKQKATLFYNNFNKNKKKCKKLFKDIVVYINENKIELSQSNKDNIKLLIHHWNNTKDYSAQDYLNMKDIDIEINNNLDNDNSSLKELFNSYLMFGEKFRSNLIKFYEYVAQIEELEPQK